MLRANPGYLDAAVQLGLTLYTLGRADEALAEWSAVLERDPTRDDARMYLRLMGAARRRGARAATEASRRRASPRRIADGASPRRGAWCR